MVCHISTALASSFELGRGLTLGVICSSNQAYYTMFKGFKRNNDVYKNWTEARLPTILVIYSPKTHKTSSIFFAKHFHALAGLTAVVFVSSPSALGPCRNHGFVSSWRLPTRSSRSLNRKMLLALSSLSGFLSGCQRSCKKLKVFFLLATSIPSALTQGDGVDAQLIIDSISLSTELLI